MRTSLILHISTSCFRGVAILQDVQAMSVLDESEGLGPDNLCMRVKLVMFLAWLGGLFRGILGRVSEAT